MRNIYDEKLMKLLSVMAISEQHPDWSDEEKIRVGELDENVQKIIRNQITKDFAKKMMDTTNNYATYFQYLEDAIQLMNEIPEELIPNVNEWIEDKPLSDIKVHGVSINDINEHYKSRCTIEFQLILRCMACWKKTNYADKNYCFYFFAAR